MKYALKDSIPYRITRAANKVNKTINKKLSPYNIAIEQRATLEMIKFEEDLNQMKIATLLNKDKTTISRSLNSLEKKGFITKTEIIDDKRNNKVELTQKGESTLEDTLEYVSAYREFLSSKLSDEEIKIFFKIMDKLEL